MKKAIASILTAVIAAGALTVSVFGSIDLETYKVESNISTESYFEGYKQILDEYKNAYKAASENFSNDLFGKYPDVSSEYIMNADIMGEPMYTMRDLDSNGIPELLVCAYRDYDPDMYFIYGIYSCRQNQVKNDFVRAGNIVVEILDTNEIYAVIPAMMYSYYVTFEYNEGNFTKIDDISNEFYGGITHNGQSIDENELSALLNETDGRIVDLEWKSADEFSAETASEEVSEAPAAADDITVLLNGEELSFTVEPYIENGVTMVPMRAIFEALGVSVDYESQTRTITAVKDDVTIILTVGSTEASKNGETVTLQAAAEIVNDSTMVPLRFVSESLGAEVGWNNDTRTVTIN